jgi:hypothetical protein
LKPVIDSGHGRQSEEPEDMGEIIRKSRKICLGIKWPQVVKWRDQNVD